MEAVRQNESGRFFNILKRIWNGESFAELRSPANVQFVNAKVMQLEPSNNVTDFKIEVKADTPVETTASIPKLVETGRQDYQPIKPDFHAQKPSEVIEENNYSSQKQTTIISRGTVIVGDLKSDGNLEIYGAVTGSINAIGNVKICGKQIGDVQGANVSLSSCTVRGNVTATEDMNIDSDSVIIGDIKTKNLMINGKLQGNIYAKSGVTCQSNAIIIGDLTAATVTINNGSKLQGKVQIFNGQIGEIKISDEDKTISEV